ncbi:MAG: response regulator containing a CheY-like receiver domain and an DNA-binding domain [Bacteroidetes bacterium]|jgi:DNA-binding NarL/FixJ family response regulator|nr:response regulator containing a CheY-like receiver domain and an DNA-binding domain [Bacteroidota bacterium]
MATKSIRLIIADDHQMFIDGIRSALADNGSIQIIATANNGKQLLSLLENETPDVILLDINMPEMNGLDAARHIVKKFPEIKIIILSMYLEKQFIEELVKIGVSGYILKNTGMKELEQAIITVTEGKKHFSGDITLKMIGAETNESYPGHPVMHKEENPVLTEREIEVLKLIALEHTTPEIAEKLFISAYTVETHRKNLIRKLNVKNIAGLVKYAVQQGFVN